MRIRTIKPEFFKSGAVAELSLATRLTFIGMWCYADDQGRGIDDPRLVKAELWPLDDNMTAKKIELILAELAERGFIHRYESDGRRYIHVANWKEHQRINRPTPAKTPPCLTCVRLTESSLSAHGSLTPGTGTGNREQGREHGTGSMEHGREHEGCTSPEDLRVAPGAPTGDVDPQLHTLLVDRLTSACTGDKLRSEARECITKALAAWSPEWVECVVGYAEKNRPKFPRYILSTLNKWSEQRGFGIPELTHGRDAA